MSKTKSISNRGLKASVTELRSDFALFFEAVNDIWTAENPTGKFPLNMAENNLSWHLLEDKIKEILKTKDLPKWVSNYTGIAGQEDFLQASCSFLENFLTKSPVQPEHLVSSAGATAVIELAAWVLCNPGDYAIIPAPSYPVYTQDINNKAGVERYDLKTHHHTHELAEGNPLKIEHLEKAKAEIEAKSGNAKLLILTNPDNPTGAIISLKKLESIADWCIENEIHLIVNELYGLSILEVDGKASSFESFNKVMLEKNSDFLHMIFGLSKDFGSSGFRVGYFYTLNENVIAAYKNLNASSMVSNLTQWLFTEILFDHPFLKVYIKENQKNITASYNTVVKKLDQLHIPYAPAEGSLFVWLELSDLLTEQTELADEALWLNIYEETGVLLTPGKGFGHSKKGQYRLVHSYLKPAALDEAMLRLHTYIKNKLPSTY